ncbi:MAG: NusG domain II-containing protein [Clostridiales bacterium]|jgi:hypothetical protein|nr:NusG domain II-containing protein [Bacillota bacterium]NLK03704.1 NusG domain II-containing protein [Clostridiales bacterium]
MKKNDIFLLSGIILLIGIAFFLMQFFKSEGSRVLITIDGIEDKVFDLSEDAIYKIQHEDGHWNTLEIKDGNVSMIDASCPDKLCVKHRSIHYNNETITCLPNKVVLKIIGGEESELDAIAN